MGAAELRKQAQELRETAAGLETDAVNLDDLLKDVRAAVTPEMWAGTAPDLIEERVTGWTGRCTSAASGLRSTAFSCRMRANQLEGEADELDKAG